MESWTACGKYLPRSSHDFIDTIRRLPLVKVPKLELISTISAPQILSSCILAYFPIICLSAFFFNTKILFNKPTDTNLKMRPQILIALAPVLPLAFSQSSCDGSIYSDFSNTYCCVNGEFSGPVISSFSAQFSSLETSAVRFPLSFSHLTFHPSSILA